MQKAATAMATLVEAITVAVNVVVSPAAIGREPITI